MHDKDKVIKGLTHCTAWNGLHECQPKVGDDCPYEDEADCKLSIMYDALAVLKEQESVIEALKSDLDETLKVLGEQPEIVRCRDCIFARRLQNRFICTNTGHCESRTVGLDWFCADGERR